MVQVIHLHASTKIGESVFYKRLFICLFCRNYHILFEKVQKILKILKQADLLNYKKRYKNGIVRQEFALKVSKKAPKRKYSIFYTKNLLAD